jgi:hypothetical protein
LRKFGNSVNPENPKRILGNNMEDFGVWIFAADAPHNFQHFCKLPFFKIQNFGNVEIWKIKTC